MSVRKIKVYSTRGQSGIEIETDVTSLGELSGVLNSHDYELDLENMKAIVGQTKATLESFDSVLPEGNFTLFLMPTKTKSGTVDSSTALYSEIRDAIKNIISNDASAYEHFNSGKSYTNKGSAILRDLLQSWYDRSSVTYMSAVEPEVESMSAVDILNGIPLGDAERLQIATNMLEKLEDPGLCLILADLCILDDLRYMLSDYLEYIKIRLSPEELALLRIEAQHLSKVIPGVID